MSDAPQTIWAKEGHDAWFAWGHWYRDDKGGGKKYTRADLPATDEQIAADPRVQALYGLVYDALTYGVIDDDIWSDDARAALAEFTTTTTTKENQ